MNFTYNGYTITATNIYKGVILSRNAGRKIKQQVKNARVIKVPSANAEIIEFEVSAVQLYFFFPPKYTLAMPMPKLATTASKVGIKIIREQAPLPEGPKTLATTMLMASDNMTPIIVEEKVVKVFLTNFN